MNITAEHIERIVREVLANLPAAKATSLLVPPSSTASVKTGTPAISAADVPQANAIAIDGKIITLAQLEKRIQPASQILLHRGALVTPAARDWLRERNVAIAFHPAKSSAVTPPKWQLACATAETDFDPAQLLRNANKDNVATDRLASTGLSSVIDELADRVAKGGMLGLLFTTKLAAGNCLANRVRGVRAASAHCQVGVKQAIAEIGLNLLVIDPRGKSSFQLGKMLQAFYGTAARECPADFAKKLQ